MPTTTSTLTLTDRIQGILDQREQHTQAIAAIDATLGQINSLLGRAKPGKAVLKPAAAVATVAVPAAPQEVRRRKKFSMTGEQSIVAFIKAGRNPTTRQINARWKQQGRGGTADSLLGEMVKAGQLNRRKLGAKLGSEYSLASAAPAPVATPSTVPGKKSGRTAQEVVLDFVKQKGSPTSREIERHWKSEKRPGRAAKTLSRLTHGKKLKRTPIVGGRGSRYSIR